MITVTGSVSLFGICNDAVWLKKAKELGQFQGKRSQLYGDTPMPEELKYERIRELQEGETVQEGVLKRRELPEWAEHLQPSIRHQLKAIFERTPATLLKNTRIHFILAMMNESELVLELVAHELQERFEQNEWVVKHPRMRRFVENLKGTIILLVELFKAVLRLILLWRNGGRMLTSMAIPSREDAIALANPENEEDKEDDDIDSEPAVQYAEDGTPIPSLPNAARHRHRYERYTLDAFKEARRQVAPTAPTTRSICGELLWIFRPVLYVLLRYQYGKVWTPWILSLVVEHMAHKLATREKMSDTEQTELTRRRSLLLLYLLRQPFFEFFTQLAGPLIALIYTALGKIPGVRTAWDFLAEILNVYRTRYFYLSGSGSP